MYSGSGFSDWEIGDITVIIHNGVYHLFHLIIPNHDYIAHAVSDDGISWKRVNNALFVGHPGEWDDDMLWTMHVVEVEEKFEMYYTGLQRKDRGIISRIGFAESTNLIDWTKNKKNIFPIEPRGVYYETHQTNPRTWLSFRDPFRFDYKNDVYLLVATRTLTGPVSRRGCVGLVKITNDSYDLLPPLLHPGVYDDVECPCIFEINGWYYLLGSIREDIQVRYWFANDFFGAYQSFSADVLLPRGNYAARTAQDGEHLLLYNFFYAYGKIDALRVLPPPKELVTDKDGKLHLKSYYRWKMMTVKTIHQQDFHQLSCLLNNPTASFSVSEQEWTCKSKSGYEIFAFEKPAANFIWEGFIAVEGMGKFGLVSDMDDNASGYFISFDLSNGIADIRSWGFNDKDTRQNFVFNDIQSGLFSVAKTGGIFFRLIRYGNYIELSIDGYVQLTLMDYTFSGRNIGIYACSSAVSLQNAVLNTLPMHKEEYASQEETN
ncbi:MAG: glycosyl hydrolase family 32 [Bacteroidetes bacterium]|nr:glycosyl hydrolase family 32 [Bacteroidota bacterium]